MFSPRRGVELAQFVGLGEPLGCLVAAAEDVPIAPALASAARPPGGGDPQRRAAIKPPRG